MEKSLSAIRVHYKALLGNIGSAIYSYFDHPPKWSIRYVTSQSKKGKGSIISVLSEFIEKVELVQREAIEVTLCVISERSDEYLIETGADLCIVFLENFKQFMDCKYSLTITDHEEDGSCGLLKVKELVILLAKSTTGELRAGEILTEYENSVPYKPVMLKDEVLGGPVVKDQSTVLCKGLLFLKRMLSNIHPMHLDNSREKNHPDIRALYKGVLRSIGCAIYLHFRYRKEDSICSVLSELIKIMELVQKEAIEVVFSISLGRMDEYLIQSRPDLFIVFLENFKHFMDRKHSMTITQHNEADGDTGLCKVKELVLLLAKSTTGELSADEILTKYVNCVQNYPIEMVKDEVVTGPVVKGQSIVLCEGLWFLKQVLTSHTHQMQLDSSSWEENLSAIRVDYNDLLESIGSALYSCFDQPVKGRISSILSVLIEKVELIQKGAIEAILSVTFGRLIESGSDPFIIFLEKFKECMDRKSGSEYKESDAGIGILKVKDLVLQLAKSTGELATDGIVTEYVNSVKDAQIEDSPKGQSKVLQHGLLFLNRVLDSHGHPMQLHRTNKNKLSAAIKEYKAFLGNIGSFIHSCFCNQTNGSISSVLLSLIEKVDHIISLVVLNSIGKESSRTHQLGFLNLLIKDWMELMDCKSDLIMPWKDQFQTIHQNLLDFRSFIEKHTLDEDAGNTRSLFRRMTDAGYVAEYLLNSFAIDACPVWCKSPWISELIKHCEEIQRDMKINIEKSNGKDLRSHKDLSGKDSHFSVTTADDLMVGFKKEKELIMAHLLASKVKQRDVVSIIGMAGLGKTTLAKKVYEDPEALSYFDVRAWCCVSQEYNKKDLFLTILSSLMELDDLTRRKSELELSVIVHKLLFGRRYLIVVDDVWEIEVFQYLQHSFPDKGEGGRVVLTSRNIKVGLGAKCISEPIKLPLLTKEESWNLLEHKIYGDGRIRCSPELCQVGEKIAKKCGGLPLAVVVVAGFLAQFKQRDFWEQVADNLNSYLAGDPAKQWTAALDLSYKYLPDRLKPLFLYLGAFPEDKEIQTDKLIWLWIAEGLVSSEHQAETYLTDLINRSLVMVAKRSDERVKSCLVHDLLRDMCLAKAKEENFMHQVNAYGVLTDPIMYQRRLSIFLRSNGDGAKSSSSHLITYDYLPMVSITPPLRTFLFFNVNKSLPLSTEATKSVFSILKLLRVLHSESTTIDDDLYNDLTRLVYLRYMSITTSCNNIPSSISNLRNLEALIIRGLRGEMVMPETIWEMVKLKHLHINPRAEFREAPKNSPGMENLSTLSTPTIILGEEHKLIRRVPNLQKLRCVFTEQKYNSLYGNIYQFPDLESLDKLKSLKMSYYSEVKLSGKFKLPPNLKKLSISTFRLEWNQISAFQNVEILKLCSNAVQGEYWDTAKDEFPNLKVLKLEKLNIKKWEASEENFPQLKKLVLERCKQLEEIPFDLGDIITLERIEVLWCHPSAANSAKEIQEEQEEKGNKSLQVHIYPTSTELNK